MNRKIWSLIVTNIVAVFVAFAIMCWFFHFTLSEAMNASIFGMIGGGIAGGLMQYGFRKDKDKTTESIK